MIYRDRVHAGAELSKALQKYSAAPNVIIIGLPRGGVVVAAEVARLLSLPLDIIVPRKLGAEGNSEYAIGALTEDGEAVWNESERKTADPLYLERVVAAEHDEANRRIRTYRGHRPPLELAGKTAILVDDGIATGLTMNAAVRSARKKGAVRVVVAVPHGAADSLTELEKIADEVIALERPTWYTAVGSFYETFGQTSDAEVISLMNTNQRP